ncbi:hypothetical protein ACFL3T_00145 [Patescibacteria group bacterium]
MPERSENYKDVVNNLHHSSKFSLVRFEGFAEKLLQVIDSTEQNPSGFEEWTEEDAYDALISLDKED